MVFFVSDGQTDDPVKQHRVPNPYSDAENRVKRLQGNRSVQKSFLELQKLVHPPFLAADLAG